MKAFGEFILLARPPQEEERRESGLILATDSEPPPQRGIVLSVGPLVPHADDLEAGVVVYFRRGSTVELTDDTDAIHCSHVMAVE